MFFMMGITDGRKEFSHNQMFICGKCGAYGRYMVYMTYTVLSLFFIPVFKWNRKYYVTTTCCNTTYQLADDIGRRIEHGESVEIRQDHLQGMSGGRCAQSNLKCCGRCGYTTEEDFTYCPKCGNRLF